MTLLTSTSGATAIIPEEWIDTLIVKPVAAESVALNPAVSTTVTISGQVGHIPVVEDDVQAAWVAEGAEITPDDAAFSEITVGTSKLASLTKLSREMAEDSSPDALQIIGAGIARDLAKQIDTAFFAEPALSGVAPKGLGSITPTSVTYGTALTSLDPFADAVAAADALGVALTAWVANPADALTLSKIKQGTGSQVPLLGTDPTQPTRRVIQGRPLLTSPAVKAGNIWGMARSRAIVVRRQGVQLETSDQVFFSSDVIAVRSTSRLGFAWPQPPAIVKLVKGS